MKRYVPFSIMSLTVYVSAPWYLRTWMGSGYASQSKGTTSSDAQHWSSSHEIVGPWVGS